MIPVKPYLLRAYFDWIVDNNWTPLVLVDANGPETQVPEAFVKDGKIVLNMALRAIRSLEMDNDSVSFSARFGGVPHKIFIPMAAVLAIYAQENGQILSFPPEPENIESDDAGSSEVQMHEVLHEIPDDFGSAEEPKQPQPPTRPKGPPLLRVVKKEN